VKIDQSFEVSQPVQRVWEFFQDMPQVAHCMPGARLNEQLPDGSYQGGLRIKVGPITAEFEGQAKVVQADAATRTGRIEGRGTDPRGGSRGSGTLEYVLSPSAVGTRVDVVVDYQLQGRIAQFGRTGVMRDIAAALTRRFAECLEGKLGAASQAEAEQIDAGEIKGIRLFLSGITRSLRRLFSHGK